MNLFLFTNFFPHQKAEPFLVNEFGFAKKQFDTISVLSLYGERLEPFIEQNPQLVILPPPLTALYNKKDLLVKGFFNLAPFHVHAKEFFSKRIFLSPKKAYWFFVSCLITRAVLSSDAYKRLVAAINQPGKAVLYFYWSDNLCWILPYLHKKISNPEVTTVMRLHGSDLYEHLKNNYAPIRNMVFENMDVLAPVSEFGKSYLEAKYPGFRSKLFLSRLGVFDHGLNPGASTGTKQVVSVSSVVPVKRVHLLFEALQKTQSRITWHHFGDGPLFDQLKELARQKRAGLDIIWHGFITNDQLMAFYKAQSVDLFVNVSESEGLPVSIMEALSFGIPVIATRVGGVSELVNETTGHMVEQYFKTEELATAVDALLNITEEKTEQLRKNARHMFEEKVSAEKNYTRFYTKISG